MSLTRNHCLVAALKAKQLNDVRTLLGADPDVQMSAVHWAVIQQHVQTLQLLLTHGASVKSKDKSGDTALHNCMQLRISLQKKLDMAKVLLNQGASANVFNKLGESPFHLAVLSGSEELTVLVSRLGGDVNLKSQCDEETVLHIAARKGSVSLIRLFLQYGARVNSQSKSGETPLHLASCFGHLAVAEVLLRHGA